VAHDGVDHAGQARVDAEARRAVYLGRQVDARRAAADEPPAFARLERHAARWRGHRGAHQLAVVRALAAAGVGDHAVGHRQLVGRQFPGERGRTDELRARGGCGQPQRLPGVGHAGRAAGQAQAQFARQLADHPAAGTHAARLAAGLAVARLEGQARDEHGHVAVDGVGAGIGEFDGRQRHVQLLGREHGQRGVDALPHLAAVHRQHDVAVGRDADPAVQRKAAVGVGQAVGAAEPAARRHEAPADQQDARRPRAGEQQAAPPHALAPRSSAAAARMATRTRG
jgi:hypothetical protein